MKKIFLLQFLCTFFTDLLQKVQLRFTNPRFLGLRSNIKHSFYNEMGEFHDFIH